MSHGFQFANREIRGKLLWTWQSMVVSGKIIYIHDGFFTIKNWRVRGWIGLVGDEATKTGDTKMVNYPANWHCIGFQLQNKAQNWPKNNSTIILVV